MLLLFSLLGLLLNPAYAQSVQQSETVTPGHVPVWITDGVIGDGGTAAESPITSLGATGGGPIICANSGPLSGPFYRMCLDASDGQISLTAFGGATPQGLTFSLNGTVYSYPFAAGGGVVGPATTVIGNVALWANTVGTLLSDGGYVPLNPANNLSDLASASTARTNLGLGSIAVQAANAVAITGGTITGLGSPLPVGSGGTGLTSPSTSGYVLTSNGTGFTMLPSAANSKPINAFDGMSHTVATTDCGHTVYMYGGLYTLTLPSVSGFSAPCDIAFCDGDSTIGKLTSGFPVPIFYILFPFQCGQVSLLNGGWQTSIDPGPWRTSNPALYMGGSGASDTTQDGLDLTRPFATIQHCYNVGQAQIDSQGSPIACNGPSGALFSECDSFFGPLPRTNPYFLIQGLGSGFTWRCSGSVPLSIGDGATLIVDNIAFGGTTVNPETALIHMHNSGILDFGKPGACGATLALTGTYDSGTTTASFTGSISGTTLTVSSVIGTIGVGDNVNGAGVTVGTVIVSGSGTSWIVNNSQSVGSESMTTSTNPGGTTDLIDNDGGGGASLGINCSFSWQAASQGCNNVINAAYGMNVGIQGDITITSSRGCGISGANGTMYSVQGNSHMTIGGGVTYVPAAGNGTYAYQVPYLVFANGTIQDNSGTTIPGGIAVTPSNSGVYCVTNSSTC